MGLIDVEVGRYDWSAIRCGCGKTAEHLAGDLLRLAAAQSREEARALHIEDHALIQSFPQEPAVPVTSVLMAALAGDLSHGARIQCLDLLIRLVDTDDDESADMCQQIARQGLWGVYRDLWSGASRGLVGYAYEILQVIETDEDRLRAVRGSGQLNLPDDLAD
ncbi:hypothetical protein [Streptomyces sp. cg40]|uniref:hypothetical protein n=1 Tax=Streptomyces sp. cg40 TaxID=3419764 RepID=UPI003D0788CA